MSIGMIGALIGFISTLLPSGIRNILILSLIHIFQELEERDPQHFAVRQYKKYKMAAGVVSVSYTHLDVYKRQVLRDTGGHGRGNAV